MKHSLPPPAAASREMRIDGVAPPARAAGRNPLADWRAVLGYRNVRVLMLGMLC